MANKCLILGKGYIGSELHCYLGCAITANKINSFQDIYAVLDEHKPDTLINCVGHTGLNNVDDCELVPDKTLQANTFLPILLAEATYRRKIKFIHISSGCIYHYDYEKGKPIAESQIPDFYDLFYSRSKIYTENVLTNLAKYHNILIARIRVPLDNKPHPKNVLTKLIQYKKVINVPNSVTYIPDFIKALKHLLQMDARGVYNVVNKKPLYYNRLMNVYQKYVPDFKYEIIDFKKLKLVRTNLILSTQKLTNSGFNIRSTDEILDECVKNYIKYS